MMRVVGRRSMLLVCGLTFGLLCGPAARAADGPDCSRPYSLALHEHGLLYAGQTGEGIDKDVADELARRSGCRIAVSVMSRARIWQLIESGALDFSLSGITNEAREKYASFAWYFSNKYYLLVRKDAGVRTHADLVDNPKLLLGVIRSFRYSPTANRMVDRLDAQQRVSYASHLEPLFEILLQNRAQAMIIEPFDYPTITSGRLREETTVLEFDDPPVPHGLIMSKKALPVAQQQAWRGVIDEMRRDGTMQRIFEKYFKPELAREMTRF